MESNPGLQSRIFNFFLTNFLRQCSAISLRNFYKYISILKQSGKWQIMLDLKSSK